MKKLTSLTGASLAGASIMVSAGALAADLTVKAPPRPPWTDSWAGPYIGAYFGAGAGRVKETSAGAFSSSSVSTNAGVVTSSSTLIGTTASNLSGDVTGSMVDLFAGYNWQAGNIVAGGQVEGTVFSDVALKPFGNQTFNSVSTNVLLGVVTGTTTSSSIAQSNQQLRSRVGLIGRLGFLARPDLLLYGLGGLELGHFTFADSADPFGGDNGKWVAGYTVGAGGELKLTGNWSLRGEYRYLNFGFNRSAASSATASSVTGATTFVSTSGEASSSHTNADFHLAKIGLVYQFGDGGPLSAMAAIPPAGRGTPSATAWGDSWAGPYIGAYFGAGAGRARQTSTRIDDEGSVSTVGGTSAFTQSGFGNLSGDMTGSMVDLFAGYNWRTGNVVVGGQIEGTLFSDVTTKTVGIEAYSSASSDNGVVTSTNSGTNSIEDRQQLRSNIGVVGRAGYLVTPNVLLYGLGGLALGHLTYPDGYPDSEVRVGGKNGKWVAGYVAGAGGEVKLTDNWSLRGEYRYMHFGYDRNEPSGNSQTSVSGGGTSTSTNSTVSARHYDADFHVGKVGLVYQFGASGPRSAMAALPGVAWNDGWAGPYIGAYFGAGAGRAAETFTTNEKSTSSFTSVGTTTSTSTQSAAGRPVGDVTGSMVDLFAGYNWRVGNVVAGGQIEGSVFSDVTFKTIGPQTFSSVDTSNGVVTTTTSSAQTAGNQIQQRLRSNVGLIGRAGYLVTPNVLLYGLGGLALGHFTAPDGNILRGDVDGKWVAGYTVGAGGEVKLTGNWSLRGEYRYTHYGFSRNETSSFSSSAQSTGSSSASSSVDSTNRQINADFHTGRIGMVYRFGEGGPPSATAALPGAPSDHWAGPYLGAYFAAGAGRARQILASTADSAQQNFNGAVLTTDSVSNTTSRGSAAGDTTGSMVDLFAGYNWRAGNIVAGGQIEGTLFSDVAFKTTGEQTSNTRQVLNGVVTTRVNPSTMQASEQLRSNVGVIGRAGYLVTPKLMLYGLGGLALGHFTFPDPGGVDGPNGKWVAGYTAGAGGEFKLTQRWSLRGEYRYTHFDIDRSETRTSSSTQIQGATTILRSNADSTSRKTSADIHIAKIGAVYGFCYCD
ncbi:outer membrane beta-barrel protein [Bradyrhizobium yuanmingense]|uniref:outer membrane protein n=1 Tax=Bradyrhizobium yuanmingense TaxID=108015 RepID=UPI0023B963FE|nr:outer membrane beta-barrel protein [Bradyrhizobium yuanmingense]MDF0520475.1 outer membrane beta-barrel protein [Bradyrhizobium yuanmingense]